MPEVSSIRMLVGPQLNPHAQSGTTKIRRVVPFCLNSGYWREGPDGTQLDLIPR